MIKATVIYTNYNIDSEIASYHVVVHHDDETNDIHQFNFTYSGSEGPDDNKDHKNIVKKLKQIYGQDIKIEFVDTLKITYHGFIYK